VKTILCIEDNPDNLKVIQLMVHRLRSDDRFITARSAEEGLAIIEQHLPDLILMDIELPGMNGFQALYQLKQQSHTHHIPVIAISAHAMLDAVNNGLAAGFELYITKPIDMYKLKEHLNHYLSPTSLAQAG